jgi:hypothetical protein
VHRPNRNERVQTHRKAGRSSCKVMMEVVRLFFCTVIQYRNLQSSIQRFGRFEMHTAKETVTIITVPQAHTTYIGPRI